MKITVVMGREPSYTRNKVILDGLRSAGVELVECTDASGNYAARCVKVMGRFLSRSRGESEAVFVGFFGQPLMPFVSRLTRKPVILDAFLSGYDTMCFDRKRFPADSLRGRLFFRLDRAACERAALVLLDTNEHINYFVETFGVPAEKFRRVFVGAETNVFYPRDGGKDDDVFNVFYYCTFLPVHGVEHVLGAARILKGERDIRFKVAGIDESAAGAASGNVELVKWIDYEKLPESIVGADVCLGGHFSDVAKAGRVIAGKTFQFLAMRKATIVGDNPANRELLTHGKDALMVKMADAEALARAILELKQDEVLRTRIAEEGYRTFMENCTPGIIGAQVAALIREVTG